MALVSKLLLFVAALAAPLSAEARDSFNDTMAALKHQSFDEGKLAVLSAAVDTDAFTCDEIAAFMKKLAFEKNYISCLKVFADVSTCTNTSSIVEPKKCDSVLKMFDSFMAKGNKPEAEKLIAAAKPGSKSKLMSDEAIGQLLMYQSSGARSDADFQALLDKVKAQPFDKLQVVKQAMTEKPSQFTAEQLHSLVKNLISMSDRLGLLDMLKKFMTGITCRQAKAIFSDLPFPNEKLEFLTALKVNIVDPQNKMDIIDSFIFDSEKTKAAAVLRDVCARRAPPNNPVFGIVQGNPVVLVLDKSGSMDTSFQLGGKWYTRDGFSHDQLASVLKSLPATTRFNVVMFSSSAYALFPDAVFASPENVEQALRRTAGNVGGSTNALGALRLVYSMKTTPEQIYFLTDGAPDQPTKAILDEIDSLDKGRKIPVNSIAFLLPGKDRGANDFMTALATKTGGFFRSVESLATTALTFV